MRVEYPTDAEISMEINEIIDRAWPESKPLHMYILEMFRQIGMANIVYGMKKYAVILPVFYIFLVFVRIDAEFNFIDDADMLMVFFMPLMFLAMLGLSIVSDLEQNVYELTMSCRYTPYHVLALRMIVVSVMLIVGNGGFCLLSFWIAGMENMLHAALLSVTVTLIYSVLYMKVLAGGAHPARQILLYGAWVGVNALFGGVMPKVYFTIINDMPLVCHVAIWILMAVLLAKELSGYLRVSCRYSAYVGG